MSIKSENLRQRNRVEKMVSEDGFYVAEVRVDNDVVDLHGVYMVYCSRNASGQLKIYDAYTREVFGIDAWNAIRRISKNVSTVSKDVDWKKLPSFSRMTTNAIDNYSGNGDSREE